MRQASINIAIYHELAAGQFDIAFFSTPNCTSKMSDTEQPQAAEGTELVPTINGPVVPEGQKKVKKIIRVKKKRPARPQIDPALVKSEPPPQTGTTFNIW